jgi:hypothetical protein
MIQSIFANCEERGQWVMAYVDSNHGASVNDVESLGWNLSLRQGCPGMSRVTGLYVPTASFQFKKYLLLGFWWWLMVIAYNL